ncbi:erythromycin esterase family protein [Niabella sp. CJ426]|uniref:erythromycin esterase family protein n=1 Tax=Niabella sp. CJ426 TaxID=3393740 RepID=UPI003CFF78EE
MKLPVMLLLLLHFTLYLFAQPKIDESIVPLNIADNKATILKLQPLIEEMGKHKIVGLGEGTHGTKEFNDIRISLIKEFVEKKGFRIICFENAFGDTYYLNQWVNSEKPVKEGMKMSLNSLWQTAEVEAFFEWIRTFNQTHADKISIVGMDFNYQANTAKIINEEIKKTGNKDLMLLSENLIKDALFYDNAWSNQMKNVDRANIRASVQNTRSNLKQIDSLMKVNDVPASDLLQASINNVKFWCMGEGGRDKNMARMAVDLAKNDKMIIWAHTVHLALKSPFKNNMVGGCGGYIKQLEPAYYSLATGTAEGAYGGTADRFNTKSNSMQKYKLPDVKKPGWDEFFSEQKNEAFFISLDKLKTDTTALPLRLIGYGPPKGILYSDEMKISDLFDGYIFIKHTRAPEYIQ